MRVQGEAAILTCYERLKRTDLNKGKAFTESERDEYRLRGLLPARVSTLETQELRTLENLRRKAYDIERYIFMLALQSRNERLFYRMVINHIEEMMPLIYTPTVGQACLEFGRIFRQPRGFYISPLVTAGGCMKSCRTGENRMFARLWLPMGSAFSV